MACQITFPSVDVVVPAGSLTPTAIIVRGVVTCQNAAASGVTISTNVTGPAVTVTPDPTGAFIVTLPVTVTVQCGGKVQVTIVGQCADGSTCSYSDTVGIDCGSCARAQLSVIQAPCSAGVQPVTLNADISIPAGATYQFQWQSGMAGAPPSMVFAISNVGGTPATIHSAPPVTFSYPPGPYTARLVQVSPPSAECPRLEISFVTQCVTCPTVTGAVAVGQCDNNGHRPVSYTLTFVPPIPQGATASAVISYGGANTSGATFATVPISTSTGSVSFVTHPTTLAPSATPYYSTATVNVTYQGQTCPPATVPFSTAPGGTPPGVVVDTCLPCPDKVEVKITLPATGWCVPLTGSATGVAQLEASVVWPSAVMNPPSPASFDWTVTRPDGSQAQRTNAPVNAAGKSLVDTATGWTGAGAKNGKVDLSLVGTYAVGATAKFPPSAGLPTNSDGTPACNLTGSYSFLLDACTPTVTPSCPTITLSVTSGGCVDPAAGTAGTFAFVATVVDPAGISTGIDWDFGDPASGAGNTTTTPPGTFTASHSYAAAGSFVVTAKVKHPAPCSQGSGSDTVATTVMVPTCPCPPGMTRNASGVCVPTPTTPSGGMSIGCWILLVLALVLIAIAAILAMVASCASNNLYVYIASVIAFVLGLVFLILWGIFCARSACPIVVTVIDILAWVTAASVILAAILQFFGCSLGAFLGSGYLGTALAVAYAIGRLTGCLRP